MARRSHSECHMEETTGGTWLIELRVKQHHNWTRERPIIISPKTLLLVPAGGWGGEGFAFQLVRTVGDKDYITVGLHCF